MKNCRKLMFWMPGLLAGAALLFAVLYALPVHRQLTVTMYDDAGTPADMQMELTVYRSVLSPSTPKITGTVAFEGGQYRSIPYFEKRRAYYFIDTAQLDKGETVTELLQNALYFPFLTDPAAPSGPSALNGGVLLVLQTKSGEGKTWRSTIQTP